MKVLITLVAMIVIFISGIWVQESISEIDPASLMGMWLFDQGKGDAVVDTSGNGNDGEIVDAERVDGKSGKGIEFDGTNHVVIPASKTVNDFLDGFTYLLWVKPLGNPSGPHVRLIERDWHNPNILIGPTDFYGSFIFNGGIDNSAVRGGTWEMDEWSFVALTHDGKTLVLYVDGEVAADLDVGEPDFTAQHDGGSIWLTRWKGGPGWDFSGVLDEVAIFNTALSEDDLNTIMTDGLEKALSVSAINKLTTTWGDIKRQE
ncbi:MAG: LamG domain-containing protein [Candidatus Poribacteria bacterium]|nr:LamG domain-containing protein [Candidatus Poribacteria bacterium]MDE0425611.1 LamG domain-containing protein [Candidatus Poribacteria bacterium]